MISAQVLDSKTAISFTKRPWVCYTDSRHYVLIKGHWIIIIFFERQSMDNSLLKYLKMVDKGVDFYRKKWTGINIDSLDSLSDLPLVFKNEMIGIEDKLLNNMYVSNEGEYNLLFERTSGSTGKCLEIAWEMGDYISSNLQLFLRRKEWYGIKTTDKLCYFYTYRERDEKRHERYRNGLGFSKIDLTIDRCIDILDSMYDYNPKWLLMQPSIAYILSRAIFEEGIEPPVDLKYIELTGEILSENNKRFIEAAFNAKAANQYGTNEVNSIAYECPEGNMHIMNNNVYVEIVDESGNPVKEGDEGLIVVTSKFNRVMPFVRYVVGDYGRLTKNTCNCGCESSILCVTRGRADDYIETESGEIISTYEFVNIFDAIERLSQLKVYQYKVIQLGIKFFEVHVVLDGDREQFEKCFKDNISSLELQDSKFIFVYEKQLMPDPKTGKLKMFKKMIGENSG